MVGASEAHEGQKNSEENSMGQVGKKEKKMWKKMQDIRKKQIINWKQKTKDRKRWKDII